MSKTRPADYAILIAFCAILFGFNLFSGRPLSLHEARLPETSREMMARGDYIIPRSGGRPWLERPPLPHWLTIAASKVLGQHCDSVWVVRLPAALAGMGTVLLTAWVAARWFGRGVGLSAGLVLATCYEFYTYSTLAEDDIYLGLVVMLGMALFVRLESTDAGGDGHAVENDNAATPLGRGHGTRRFNFVSTRPWRVAAFFAVLGLANLVKGPLVGDGIMGAAVGSFLLWELIDQKNLRRLLPYLWLWGWLLFLLIALAWPIAVTRLYPDVKSNWLFDYAGTEQYDQPFWYYPVTLLGSLAPWTPAAIVGLILISRRARNVPGSAERMLLCWAIMPILLLSIPHRKHHHYLVPTLPPWGILAAVGLKPIADMMFRGKEWSRRPAFGVILFGLPGAIALLLLRHKLPGPASASIAMAAVWLLCVAGFYVGLHRRSAAWTFGSLVAGLAIFACWGQAVLPDLVTEDTKFLRQVEATVPHDQPLMVNADLRGELDFFRNQFYLRPSAKLLHNLTFLRDENLTAREVFVVTRYKDLDQLQTLGQVSQVLRSDKTRREKSVGDRFTLFRVQFDPALKRYPAVKPEQINTLQAMGREKGPYCGPAPQGH